MLGLWFLPIIRLSSGWWHVHTWWGDLLRAWGVVEAWRCGLWDARWFPGFDYGYGYPFLSYYAPLFHWLSGLWLLLFSSPTVAVRVNLFCWLVFGTAGIYLAGNRVWIFLTGSRYASLESADPEPKIEQRTSNIENAAVFRPGLMCAMGWLMSPYFMSNVFVRGALAEFASCQAAPWVLWAAFGILGREGRWSGRDSRECLLLVLFLAVGILAHNFFGMCLFGMAAAMLPFVLIVKWFGSQRSNNTKATNLLRVGFWVAGLGWALLATIFYWLPALREARFVNLSALTERDYSYHNHYLYLSNLLNIFYWDFGVSIRGPNDQMPLHLGLVGVVGLASAMAAIVVVAVSKSRRNGRLLAGISAIVAATAAGTLLTTPLSGFLWDRISLLQFAQFPWRLLNIPTIGICLLLPAVLVAANPKRYRPATAATLVVLAICFAISCHFYGRVYGEMPLREEHKPENWEKTQILTADVDEYGPIWRSRYRPPNWPRGALLGDEQIEILHSENRRVALEASIRNKSDQPRPLVIAWNYFPGWHGRIEPGHKPLTLLPGPTTGFILVESIPPGPSSIHVWFGDTPLRRTCKIVSGLAWLLWFGLWIVLVSFRSSIFACNRGSHFL